MILYRSKNSNIVSFKIIEFKGMNLKSAKKTYNTLKYEKGRQYFDLFSERFFSSYSDKFTKEDKEILSDLLMNFGINITKTQEKYIIANSIYDTEIKNLENMNKKLTTIRIEEAFIYTLLIANDTNNFTEILRKIITDYILENNLVKLLEKINKLLCSNNNIKNIDDLLKIYV